MIFLASAFIAFLAAVSAHSTNYHGYKVYEIHPMERHHTRELIELFKHPGYDVWTEAYISGGVLHIMVAPYRHDELIQFLHTQGIQHRIIVDDVESTIWSERNHQALHPPVAGKISFDRYYRYRFMQRYLARLSRLHPEIVSLENVGRTTEGRELTMIKIGVKGGKDKPVILVDGGIHAREWISPAVVLYIIHQLVENPSNRPLIESTRWYIIPVLNPDGYEFTHTSSERYWRKTRSRGIKCIGVDPNRNFDFHWMESGASDDECSVIYAGPYAFSEPETRALRDVVLNNAGRIKLYLTFHSHGQYILYPWGFSSPPPGNVQELRSLAENVKAAIRSVNGTTYKIGSSKSIFGETAGGSDDWVMGVGGVDLSYTLELPAGGVSGLEPPGDRIKPICEETWEGVVVYQKYIAKKFST